jgi:hypothetical protein
VKYWIGVASADHVAAAVAGGFVQLGHGKAAPVRRLAPRDVLALYSPRAEMRAGTAVQSFTAIGSVCDREPYRFQQTASLAPIRRDVAYFDAQAARIEPLLDKLSFIRSRQNWGMAFRRGLVEVSERDMEVIAEAMSVMVKYVERFAGPGSRAR